jgi:2-hydroxy fatty acid dioxygenase
MQKSIPTVTVRSTVTFEPKRIYIMNSKVQPPPSSSTTSSQHTTTNTSKSSRTATISYYLSHLFHGCIYYYCVKYIIHDFILGSSSSSSSRNNSIISSLAFYGVYHRTPYNQLIHLIGVPFIIWTMILFGTYLPLTTPAAAAVSAAKTPVPTKRESRLQSYVPQILQWPHQHRMTWATLWVLLYVTFYLYIDWVGACMYIPFLYIMYVTSVHWSQSDLQPPPRHTTPKKMKDDSIDPPNTVVSTRPNSFRWYGTGNLLFQAFIIHILSWYIQIHLGHGILEGATPASLVNLGAALTSAPLFAFYEMIWYLGYRLHLQQQVLQQVLIYTEQLCTAGANLRVCTMSSTGIG